LLGISWLLGLDYYEMPSLWTQAAVLTLAAWMLAASDHGYMAPANPFRATREAYPELTWATLLLLLPVAWWTPWPYRLAPAAIIAGLVLERVPFARRAPCVQGARRPLAAAAVGRHVLMVGGVILLAQAVALTLYAAVTARNHDLPGAFVKPLAGLCSLAGIDAAADGPMLVMQSMRQSHRLAISWDMVFDPATLMFLVGGLAWITIDSGRANSIRLRWAEWGKTVGRFVLIVAAWLPLRALMLLALYVHRAAASELDPPPRGEVAANLHVMNQFFSSWVLLAMLVPPVLLAWRWVRLPGDAPLPAGKEDAGPATDHGYMLPARPRGPLFRTDSPGSLSVTYLAAAACCLFGTILVALGLQWEPIGTRKAGRVMIVEKHSPWSPSDFPFDKDHLGGGDDENGSSYNYAAAYKYLGQYYDMSRLKEEDPLDDQALEGCDVLVIKIPRYPFTREEVGAVTRFVEGGGGLLLIGDHTNLEKSSAHMNDITRAFGFTFRHDVLYSSQPSPDQEHWSPPMVPHPAIEHVPEFDFAVSCSIDPGFSRGRPVVSASGLWSMPCDYEFSNYMSWAIHVPEMRFGPFVQAWSTHGGRGRVIAWGDSTIFSNFCLYQPGKAQVLLNLVEWLNHQGGAGVWWLWTLLGLGAIGNGLWLVRRPWVHGARGSAWLVLVAATACGWVVGSTATAAIQARQMPLPAPQEGRRLPQIVIDRTTSQVPLAKGADNEDPSGAGFGLLEQAIPRLGYTTVRAEGDAVFQGEGGCPPDAVVMICPSRPATEAFRKRLVEYVAGGGRLLVIDLGSQEVPSTTNQILRPFGLALDYSMPWKGELVLVEPWPRLQVNGAWEVRGGESVATFNGERAMCAIKSYGNGFVMVASFGSIFNDGNLGNYWWNDPTPAERTRYDVFFALLQRLVEDKPIAAPARSAKTTQPKISVPPNRPTHRDMGPQRHGAR
jgi:hypothetical protein